MSGTRFVFISKGNQVFRIPEPKGSIYKAIPQLANEEVLEVILHYETRDRKPHKLLFVSFNRLCLDINGQNVLTEEEFNGRSRNFILFALQTPETLSKAEEPLPIPTALPIPTQAEKECLKNYLKEFMPQLYPKGLQEIEREIQSRIQINLNNKKFVKDAEKLRKKIRGF